MKYKITKGIHNNYLLKYTNANFGEWISATLESLGKLDWKKSKVIVIIESDKKSILSHELEQQINMHLKNHLINECIIINPSRDYENFMNYGSIDQLLKVFDDAPIKDSIISIIGKDEDLVNLVSVRLTENITNTNLVVDLDAIIHNLDFYRGMTNPPNKVMAMVKANAYGHGIIEVSHHLKDKVAYLGVAYISEGIAIRKHGIKTPVMVMNPSPEDFHLCIAHELEPEIYSLNSLNKLNTIVKNKRVGCGVHIEIDTGMHRLGIELHEINELIELLIESEFIQLNGLYSHLACAEDPDEDLFNKEQLKNFNDAAAKIESELGINTIKHIRNSAGTLRYPDSPTDMIRLGIGLYGVDSNKLYQDRLKNISSLKTVVSQIRKVAKGETIGYNRTFKAEKYMAIATIAIGYADGFKRLFSNGRGHVMINGNIVPVVGRVNMDMTMIDITDIEAKEGDEVTIFNEDLHVTTLAEKADTISYEIFTSIGERVGREYEIEL